MSDWLINLILGVVEGITEFIPVSSTGHLLVAERLLHVEKSDLFNIVIQCGAVIAVLPLFPQRIYKFIFEWREKETLDYLLKIAVAFGITGAVGFVLDKKGFKLPEDPHPVAIALLVGGLAFLAVEFFLRGKKPSTQITWTIAIAVAEHVYRPGRGFIFQMLQPLQILFDPNFLIRRSSWWNRIHSPRAPLL